MEMFILAVCLSADPIAAPWDEPRVKSLEDRVAALAREIGVVEDQLALAGGQAALELVRGLGERAAQRVAVEAGVIAK